MMRLPRFTYLAPVSLKEAVTLLRECGTTAAVVAGGTDLYPSMKRGQVGPEVVVSIGKVRELYGISGDPAQGMIIGAMTPLADVAAHPDIRRHYPAVAVAASSVGAPVAHSA